MQKKSFGATRDNQAVELYVLRNKHNVEAGITDFGATLVSLKTFDREGGFADIVLGYDDVRAYERGVSFFGGTIGRCANRIAGGEFTLDNRQYRLARNNEANHLHGGERGFHKVLWHVAPSTASDGNSLLLRYTSVDGEENYPGTLHASVCYTLTDDNELRIEYRAMCDGETIVNLTNHSYFNLAGAGDIRQHELKIFANSFTPVDETLIPTGEIRLVRDTPFDFTHAKPIGAEINRQDAQLRYGKGYDHNFVLNKTPDELALDESALAAEVYEPASGRAVQVSTTEPGLQFYSGNFLNGEKGKGGRRYDYREGFCLEAQRFPDSPNKPHFPSVTLKPGARYTQRTVYKFTAR